MLETIWFILWGVLWTVYFCLDGYDLGMGMLMPCLTRDDRDRRILLNAGGPFWDGNEVWLITAGGATFAAFPKTYAVLFSSLYTPLMLLLFALILRGVSFEFRSKVESPSWRRMWDWFHTIGSFLPALLLGVAFANIFKGIPIDGDGVFHGNLLTLLNPYGLAGGVLFVLLFAVHGSIWLAIKSEGGLHDRAVAMAERLWLPLLLVAVIFLAMTAGYTQLYANYLVNPVLLVLLALPVVGLVTLRTLLARRALWKALGASAAAVGGTALFGVAGLYPALLPSSLSPAYSLTIYNSASTTHTLSIMLGVAGVFVPIVIIYQAWMHLTFSHKVRDEDLEHDEAY